MSGANTTSSVGAGFITLPTDPHRIIKTCGQRVYVCERRTTTWHEIIAEFKHEEHATLFVKVLETP